jgi:hypothetical protein
LIVLSLFVCLAGSPVDCRNETLPFDGSLQQCSLFGQMAAAEWQRAHPKLEIRKYRCASAKLHDA